MNQIEQQKTLIAPGLLRRLAAIFYDSLLLIALLMAAALPIVLILDGPPKSTLALYGYRVYLLIVSYSFFAWFWLHGGQTLGMRAWRIKVIQENGNDITIRQSLIRFLSAIVSLLCLGIGFLWVLFNDQKLSWHDKLSGTRLIRLMKN